MALKLFNTLTRKLDTFKPIKEGEVSIYACGPTVYNFAHIGNLRTYIFNDILRKVLLFNGLKVKQVMNITDVGHLTSDADEGEDKMLKGAKREGKTVWEVAEFYTKAFKENLEMLNIKSPDIWSKATDHINDMIELIKDIEKNGYAYEAGGNVYFDTSKFKDYGKLAKLKLDDQKAAARTEVDPNKKHARDFALWFTKSKFDEQEMKWDSPWGTGYPGWHIECSAMSIKYLGKQFDIHTGGIDHIPVHHTNEIAQSEAATGKKPWVKYWIHGEFLVIDKGKMAKSGENFITLKTLIDKGFDPLDYRYFCLQAHYKTQLTFSFEALDAARTAFKRLKEKVLEIKESQESKNTKNKEAYQKQFIEYINDDLNVPRGLALLWDLIKDDEIGNSEKYELILEFDKVLGLKLDKVKKEKIEVPKDVQKLVDEREAARKAKDWKKSDELRYKISKSGFIVKDTKEGPVLTKE